MRTFEVFETFVIRCRWSQCLEDHALLRGAGAAQRPYIKLEWCVDVIAAPLRRNVQSDGRIRYWGKVAMAGEVKERFLRVVTLEDGETIHNAFFDRNFREEGP